jgi:hypothetical protein
MELSSESQSLFGGIRALMAKILNRDVSFSQVNVADGLHQAAALAAMTLLFTTHRSISNIGFTLRREGISTDTYIVLIVGLVALAWTTLVVISGVFLQDRPCRQGFRQCAARMAYVPWILVILFLFWLIAFTSEILYLRTKDSQSPKITEPEVDPESLAKQKISAWAPTLNIFHFLRLDKWRIWNMECSHGATNWAGSVSRSYRWALYGTMLAISLLVSTAAITENLFTTGLLTLVGVILFIVGASGQNKYETAPHIYTRNTLRVMLHTRHKEGTSYILPCRNRGFDAVWGPKIEYENRSLDEAVEKFQDAGGYAKGKLIWMDKVMASFNAATDLTIHDVNDLASWLYEPGMNPQMCRVACKRAPGIHLIGHSLVQALWQAEYLVFQKQSLIREELREKIGSLRAGRGSGLDLGKRGSQIGSKPGLDGYQEAVRYVYKLLGEKADGNALNPTSECPTSSVVLDPCPANIEEYVAQLWRLCFETQESTFAALFAFTTYWQADIGNDPENGWHGFPLRVKDREGDIITWHIIWRQAWYGAVISQLTSMSPIIFSAFIAGVLQ